MRLFTAIELSEEIRANLENFLSRLRATASVRWSPPQNLHITTKFIGEWPQQKLSDLNDALGRLPARAPIEIGIRGLGWFPNAKNPRVFWAGIHAGPPLEDLARDTEFALAPLGIIPSEHPYEPHLTLARIAPSAVLEGLRTSIRELGSPDFGTFSAISFRLFLSRPGPSAQIYTPLAEFPLAV